MKCCDKILTLQKGKQDGIDMVYYVCESCGKKGKGKNKQEAENNFIKSIPTIANNVTVGYPRTGELQPIPEDREKIIEWSAKNMSALINQSAQFIGKPATQRMIEKNIRYISSLKGKAWDKVWASPEGQESISHSLAEALYHAATLPEMGSIVPFGSTAEFIPSVECFKFGLETGKNAPFKDINIILIYENDQTKISQEDGNFKINVQYGIPRGEIIAVAVSAIRNDTEKTIGDVYDVGRLMGKARQHSPSYRNYLTEKEDFKKMKSEGNLKTDDSGREFMEKKIEYVKNGQPKSFIKKIYYHDIVNPYDGPDRPEMLRKSAGKSFFRPYMRVRNAAAMADEWQSDESVQDEISRDAAADDVLNKSMGQFKNTMPIAQSKIKDAEMVPENKPGGEKKDLKKNQGHSKSEDKDFNIL